MVTGVIGASAGPFAGDGLDETLGLAIGLRAIGTGEAMFDAELLAGVGEEFGAIGGAAVGQNALDVDAMSFVEVDGLLEGRQDAGSLFVWEERGKSAAAVIVDGDVKALDAGAWMAVGAVAGGAAQGEDLGFELSRSFAGLATGDRGTILEALWEPLLPGACEPAPHGLFADAKSRGGDADGETEGGESGDHLCSRQWGQSGISVHVVRAGGRWVECSSTTSLPNPFRADNLLKHDT